MRKRISLAPVSAVIIAELSTALFTVLLRALIAQRGVSQGVIALMADGRMARAVDAVVRAPELPWTLDSLAQVCNVSRATLARRFAQLGMTPLEMVTTLRMERAARLLRQDGMSAAAVAERCGYASQAAFGRAFTQHFGVGPVLIGASIGRCAASHRRTESQSLSQAAPMAIGRTTLLPRSGPCRDAWPFIAWPEVHGISVRTRRIHRYLARCRRDSHSQRSWSSR